MRRNEESGIPKSTKGLQTSLRIQLAAVNLVIEHGIVAATVERMCQVAEVSERTFFNYFETKELAIIGSEAPRIDEEKARAFLAARPGDIFTESLELLSFESLGAGHPELFFRRLTMMEKYPELLALTLGKLLSVRSEHMELVYLRLRRTAPAKMADEEVRAAASLISDIAGSYLRVTLEQGKGALAPGRSNPIFEVGSQLSKVVELGRNS